MWCLWSLISTVVWGWRFAANWGSRRQRLVWSVLELKLLGTGDLCFECFECLATLLAAREGLEEQKADNWVGLGLVGQEGL